jgi:preprotein translocase subunit SecG
MEKILIILHVFISLLLIIVVILQPGNRSTSNVFSGLSSKTIFTGYGVNNFLSKITFIIAILFMITSLFLSFISNFQFSVLNTTNIEEELKK